MGKVILVPKQREPIELKVGVVLIKFTVIVICVELAHKLEVGVKV